MSGGFFVCYNMMSAWTIITLTICAVGSALYSLLIIVALRELNLRSRGAGVLPLHLFALEWTILTFLCPALTIMRLTSFAAPCSLLAFLFFTAINTGASFFY